MAGSMLTTLPGLQAKLVYTFRRSAHWRGIPTCPDHGARAERAVLYVNVPVLLLRGRHSRQLRFQPPPRTARS
jgi:hypothetical protein